MKELQLEAPSGALSEVEEEGLIAVLHIDDETGFLEATKKILEMQAPIHMYTATSVVEAKKILRRNKVDVIISDYEMPDKTGLEFLKELRKRRNNIPFIVLTGKGREEVAIEALNNGANGYFNKLGKPATVYGQLMYAVFSAVKAKRAEEDLLKFKTISDRAGFGVMLIDLDGTLLYCNDALARMHGYTLAELAGKNHRIFHTEDDYAGVAGSREELFDTGYLIMEERHLRKDGSLIPVLTTVTLIRDRKETPLFIAVIVTDITEKKIVERKLEETERRLWDMLDNMMEGCQIIGYDWRYLYVNDVVAKHGRSTKKELLEKTMMEAYPGIEKTKMFSVLRKSMKERTMERMENEFTYPNGEKNWFELRIQPVPEGIFILSIDINERKQAELTLQKARERFETYFDLAQVMLIAIDGDERVSHINKKGCDILGYMKEEVVGKNWFSSFLPKRLRKETKAYFRKLMSGEIEFVDYYENPVLTKNGEERLIAWHNILLRDKHGNIRCTLSSGEDVTERKKVEEALSQTFDELSLANDKLGVVGKLTRHDVRNKLSVVSGNVFISKQMLPPDHEAVEYLEKVENVFAQIEQIFDRARTYERLGVDKLSYIDVNEICEEVLFLLPDLGEIEVAKDCEGLTVYADSLLGQLFYNLVDNSLKHGKKVTKIRMYYKETGNGLQLIYEDNGVGVPESEKKKIFEEGYGNGTGIGLYMIQRMCDIYGWSIEETGKEGKGVKFTITIPKRTKNGHDAYIMDRETKETN